MKAILAARAKRELRPELLKRKVIHDTAVVHADCYEFRM